MIFRRLIHPQSTLPRYLRIEGTAISLFTHAILIGGWLAATRNGVQLDKPSPTFTPAQYLIPKDRLEGSRPKQEHVTWTELVATDPGAGQLADPLGDKEKLTFVRPKGEANDDEKAPDKPIPQPEVLGDSVMTELEVDSVAVRYEDSAAPPYPQSMLRRRIEGTVIVQYVVDTLGRADTASFKVLFATHKDFVTSVRNTLPHMRFRPALFGNEKVKQLVQQPFSFKIIDTTMTAKRP